VKSSIYYHDLRLNTNISSKKFNEKVATKKFTSGYNLTRYLLLRRCELIAPYDLPRQAGNGAINGIKFISLGQKGSGEDDG